MSDEQMIEQLSKLGQCITPEQSARLGRIEALDAMRQRAEAAEAKLAIALGADKPDKPATPTERARHWALEAAAQKERAEAAEARVKHLDGMLEMLPEYLEYWDACDGPALSLSEWYTYRNGYQEEPRA